MSYQPKAEDVTSFDLIIQTPLAVLRITWNAKTKEWQGTPGTNGQDTAKLAIDFLKTYIK